MNRSAGKKRTAVSKSHSHSSSSSRAKSSPLSSALVSLSPFTSSKRSVVSYQTAKTTSDYTRHAKSIQKRGEKTALEFKPIEAAIATTRTLADGKVVQIFKEKVRPVRQFYPANRMNAKPRLNLENATEFIHDIATKAATTPFEQLGVPEIAQPHFVPLNMLFRKRDRSNNQRTRRVALIQEAKEDIKDSKQITKDYVSTLRKDISNDVGVVSTPDQPLEFGDDLALKFKVIDSVIKQTKVIVPSSALAKINNVNDLTEWVIAKKKELDAKAEAKNTPALALPENVTVTNIGTRNRTKEPKWKEYKKLRESNQVASV